MIKLRNKLFLLALSASLAAPLATFGSGSYCACLPKPPARLGMNTKADRATFDLGQKVFNGKTAPAQGNATEQRLKLEALQTQLPAKTAAKKDLTALAGKLTDEQLAALEYFVKQRYPTSK